MQSRAELVVRSLSATHLKKVAGTADFPQMLIVVLRNTPSIDPQDLRTTGRLARTAEFKRDLVERAGGCTSPTYMAKDWAYGGHGRRGRG